MNILYFDCSSGISGDMAVGAFLDMGIGLSALARELAKMSLPLSYDIEAEKTVKNGVSATAFRVIVNNMADAVSFSQMEQWIGASTLAANVKRASLGGLRLLANARKRVYGEEGLLLDMANAVVCAVNLVASSACVLWSGAETVICSPLTEGSGFAETQSGFMRLPVPTVMELARAASAPFQICGEKTQLVTETGAAIACAWARRFGEMPSMTVGAVGFGAGAKDLNSQANVLRIISGKNEYRFFEESVCIVESDSAQYGSYWQCGREEEGDRRDVFRQKKRG